MKDAGLLGRTLGHSLSPAIHRFFGDYAYRLYAREEAEVADFVRTADFGFLNVTIPYKRTVAALCDELTPLARRLGNMNFVRRDSAGRLVGDNTDHYGFARLVRHLGFDVRAREAAVLGAGGAATTVKAVLEDLGASAVRFVRRGETPSPSAELIVNATPVGTFPHGDETRIDIAAYPNCRAVLDLVYNPSPTRLVREARAAGKPALDGMVMLLAQAARAFALAGGELPRNLFLYGPPAAGKSTWARRLAAATDFKLVDLDAEIVQAEGMEIADIFARRGEAEFRRIEAAALRRIAAGSGQVVALGGGALLDPASRAQAEAAGRVVLLRCPEAELLRRAQASAERPLLEGDRAELLAALLKRRQGHYDSFSHQVELS